MQNPKPSINTGNPSTTTITQQLTHLTTMAIKVALAAALLVALVALAGATTYTTTITTTSYDSEANPASRQQCSQVVQQREFRACQEFLSPRSQYEEEIGMRSVNPRRQEEAEIQNECCQSLKEMESQGCECEAIKQAVKRVQDQQQQRGQGQQMGQESQQMYDKAKRLPRTCNLRTQQCQFQVVFL